MSKLQMGKCCDCGEEYELDALNLDLRCSDCVEQWELDEAEDDNECLCGLCSCGGEQQYGHLCAYCDSAHPEYHKDDCDECSEE